jgi:hypothetical protein
LQYFSDAVATFVNDMIGLEMGDRVVGLTVSEFGRRPYENGSYGTDHGTSNVQFVFGTQVNSGIFGKTPDLKNLDENGDLVYDIDYREVYAEILTDWFGVDLADARDVLKNPFPGEDDSDQIYPLDVIKAQQNSAARDYTIETLSIRANYPNPFSSGTTLEVAMPAAGNLSIEISSLSGGEIMRVMSRDLGSGVHQIPLSLDLSSGNYLCIARAGGAMASKMIQCVR